MIVRVVVEPLTKELPHEYAVENNRLISLELEGTIG
jgi:Fe-S cluster assembly scaffold protein SufB